MHNNISVEVLKPLLVMDKSSVHSAGLLDRF
jgi:hypothetical protein